MVIQNDRSAHLEDLMEKVWRATWKRYDKICITGPPDAGKTTFANLIPDHYIVHTDDYYIGAPYQDWLAARDRLLDDISSRSRVVIEGCYALRIADDVTFDFVIHLVTPYFNPTPKAVELGVEAYNLFQVWRARWPKTPLCIMGHGSVTTS